MGCPGMQSREGRKKAHLKLIPRTPNMRSKRGNPPQTNTTASRYEREGRKQIPRPPDMRGKEGNPPQTHFTASRHEREGRRPTSNSFHDFQKPGSVCGFARELACTKMARARSISPSLLSNVAYLTTPCRSERSTPSRNGFIVASWIVALAHPYAPIRSCHLFNQRENFFQHF
jgi:hypothetical protein